MGMHDGRRGIHEKPGEEHAAPASRRESHRFGHPGVERGTPIGNGHASAAHLEPMTLDHFTRFLSGDHEDVVPSRTQS
jgi:hypothetical protein